MPAHMPVVSVDVPPVALEISAVVMNLTEFAADAVSVALPQLCAQFPTLGPNVPAVVTDRSHVTPNIAAIVANLMAEPGMLRDLGGKIHRCRPQGRAEEEHYQGKQDASHIDLWLEDAR